MKLKIFTSIAPALFAAALFASCSNDDIVQNGQNNTGEVAGIVFEGATQTPALRATRATDAISATSASITGASTANATTRTTATHTIGKGSEVAWEATDNIWVKDDGGTFQESTGTTIPSATNKAHATFSLTTGSFTGTTHQVVYTGKNSTSATEVEIKATQTQAVTNSFAHLGESGDCGIATATRNAGKYDFTLDHKAAYLCIYPRIEYDALHKNVKIEKIVLTSTSGPIAGKYNFSPTTGLGSSPTPTSAASNTITLNTTSGEISSATRADTCYYVVIAPGTHSLKVKYYIKDPSTNVTKIVHKDLGTIPCDEGKITDVSAWIDKELVEFNSFYIRNAAKPYWYGYEDVQPFTNGASNPNYPQPGDERYYDRSAYPPAPVTNPLFIDGSPRHVPNINELCWYLQKGNPTGDAAGAYVFRAHLQKGDGVWFKKMSKIIADNPADVAAAGGNVSEKAYAYYYGYQDLRTNWFYISAGVSANPSSTPLTVDEQADYFFLPFCIGNYSNGTYSTSSTNYCIIGGDSSTSWNLYGTSGSLGAYYFPTDGIVAVPFF